MKLQKLKTAVYKLAQVKTIRQLRTKYEALKSLDMRRRSSWEQALALVQQHQQEFTSWVENPPDEYKELFAEIDLISTEHNNHLALQQKHQAIISIAEDLEALADEMQDEGDRLKQEVELARRIAQQADLN